MDAIEFIQTIFIALNTVFIYYGLVHNRKQVFEDELFKLKFDLYRKLHSACHEKLILFDVNSLPFFEVYKFDDKEKWKEYFEKEVSPLYHKIFELEKTINDAAIHLPENVLSKLIEFKNECFRYVTISSYMDVEVLIQKQDKLNDVYFELFNLLRSDLNIEVIDGSLKARMKENLKP